MPTLKPSFAFLAPLLLLSWACSSASPSPGPDAGGPGGAAGAGGGLPDAGTDAPPDAPAEAGTAMLTPCPTQGPGSIVAPGVSCFAVTPAETGASASGQNADEPSYALFPDSNAKDELVVFLNGSGGHPALAIADPAKSFYTAATSLGYPVLALSYFSDTTIAMLCGVASATTDACYFPTRKTVVLGVFQPGAAAALMPTMTVDQGIAGRLELALSWLAKNDPQHAWGSFLTTGSGGPETRIAWEKIVAAGHSQGGGHAAAIGKLFPVARVVQLSSVCDRTNGGAASWTAKSDGPWASDPTQFYGLAAPTIFTGSTPTGGDTICPAHVANWMNLGMDPSHQHDDAATCGMTGVTHNASIKCADNYPAWVGLLQ